MSEPIIAWGHNPGQRFVKDAFTDSKGQRKDTKPYPAVIAPWAESDDVGFMRKSRDLTARVGNADYIGGDTAERLPLANRQMAQGRLDADSPVYQAFAQMSLQHMRLFDGRVAASTEQRVRPAVVIATALPVGWRDADAEESIKQHVRIGLRGLVNIKDIFVQSEPNAVVSYEMLDDTGNFRSDQAALAKGLVCVGDIGGSTLNRSVLENLRALPGQSASPLLGSRQVIEALMQKTGQQYLDAERRLEEASKKPGADPLADGLLKQYRETVIGTFQQAWSIFKPLVYLFAGGTVHWFADDLRRAFARSRIVQNPQQAIAVGLWRYARRKIQRGS